jgi:hypothetical protein
VALDHRGEHAVERFQIEGAIEASARLAEVGVGACGVEAVQEHALLGRRQGVDVLDVAVLADDAIEGGLVEPGQREVGRCEAAGLGCAAMGDERTQGVENAPRQGLDGSALVYALAVLPMELEPTARHQHVYLERMGAGSERAPCRSHRFVARSDDGSLRELWIDLTEVVERERRPGQGREPAGEILVDAQVLQEAVADPVVRNGAKLLLHALDAAREVFRIRDLDEHRVFGRETADGAREVDRRQEIFASMALEIDLHRAAAGPVGPGQAQRRHQQVVGSSRVGALGFLEEGAALVFVEPDADRARASFEILPVSEIVRKLADLRAARSEPIGDLGVESVGAGKLGELRGPLLERRCLGREDDLAAEPDLTIRGQEILEEQAPRHAVDHEVMSCTEEPRGPLGSGIEVDDAEHGAIGQIEARLSVRGRTLDRRRVFRLGQLREIDDGPRDVALPGCGVRAPLAVVASEAHAQRIVVLQQMAKGRAE